MTEISEIKNPNHPKKGSSTKVEPIKDRKAIARIKKLLADNPRDLCLFTFGVNTAYRANEILSLKVKQVAHLNPADILEIKQSKTDKYRAVPLNEAVIATIQDWLKHHPNPTPDAPLFPSQKTRAALAVPSLIKMVKGWCADVGLKGNYGSHTLRKTWGFTIYRFDTGTPQDQKVGYMMGAYGHESPKQTLDYICVQDEEVSNLFKFVV